MLIAPEPTIIDQQINGILTYEGDRLQPDWGKIEGENRPITLITFGSSGIVMQIINVK
ncbi:MAG: hypothetical protein ACKO1I_05260 [Microcystis aeruginosa]